MGINDEKGKSHEDYIELRILYLIWVLGALYYQGGYIGWVGEVQTIKIYSITKNSCQVRHIRPPSRIPETLTGHVRPPGQTCPTSQPFSELTKHIRSLSRLPDRLAEHVRVSDTPVARFSWGAIKDPPCLPSMAGHLFHIVNTLRHSLELPTSLLHASPWLSLQIFIHSYSYLKVLPQKCLEEKVSHGYLSQNFFLRNSHPFVGYTLYWIFIPWFSSL
jgi:hypothetical protein